MNLIRLSIVRPIAVVSAVIMVVLFGLLALKTIPIQLTPDVQKPLIEVTTNWPGAAPAEIEREIVNRQEDEFRGLEGLEQMISRSQDGRATVELEFDIGQNMDKALLLVANRLDRVNGYPDEADEPTIDTSSADDNPITWIVLRRLPGVDQDIHTFGDFVEDVVQDRIERVGGVSRVNVYGTSLREMQMIVDPERMARYGLTITDVVNTLRTNNASISAGDIEEGKRRYVVRSEAEYHDIDDVKAVVLRSDRDGVGGAIARVTVADIADVTYGYQDPTARIRFLGEPALAINAVRETGANVIETMKGIREALAELNDGALTRAGLYMTQVYDETIYINSAIDLVQQNIFVGGALAACILLLFLRSGSATLVISLAIPVSVIGSFVAMTALGRSLNVISLAGIAFAVGMVVDAAIVVLENIYRLRERGMPKDEAAYRGAQQVWGAVLVSALTTVMVFIPILVMDLEVGQLFRDIAVAISVAVILSLIVSITVIPALSNALLKDPNRAGRRTVRIGPVDRASRKFVDITLGLTRAVTRDRKTAALTVLALVLGAAVLTVVLKPKLDYLPTGNRNLVFGFILPPPGYNLATTTEIATRIETSVRPLWPDKVGAVEGSLDVKDDSEVPKMQRFFFVSFRGSTILGAAAQDPSRVKELIPVLQRAAFMEPGTFGAISQRSLFGRGNERVIELNISGPNLIEILDVAQRAVLKVGEVLPREQGTQIRPQPGLTLGAPEVRVIPDRVKLADNGVSARDLGNSLDAFNDGLRVAEITVDGKRIDFMIKGPEGDITETQGINFLPVVTDSGTIVPVSSLATVEVTAGPTEIRHLERVRTVTLQITPPENLPLEAALDSLQAGVVDPLRAEGVKDEIRFIVTGTADKLSQTWDAMIWQLLIAVVIVYLVMAVLFESFIYPLIILLSVPLATAGGLIGLGILNLFTLQPLDMLTLLGFVILIGIVVNNAILLVHQSLYHIREEKMAISDAILEATENRIRPIFMSTLTSVFGMLPLVVFPGAGSELYRGLGSVVVGGLSLSAVLTLAIIPPLLTLFAAAVERRRSLTKGEGPTRDSSKAAE